MRTLSLPAKLAAYLAAAAGLVVSLGLPWYGDSPRQVAEQAGSLPELGGPTEEFFGAIWRWITASDGTSGWTSLQVTDVVLVGVAVLALVGAGLALAPATENFARSVLRLLPIVALVATTIAYVDQPGHDELVEGRHGSFVAFACGLTMLVTASSLAATRRRGVKPAPMSALHDPRLARSHSVGPPGAR